MPVRLRIRPPSGPERAVEVGDGVEVRFGRRAGIEVTLPFATVSGLHARLVRAGGGWVLEDAGSTNGTFADGQRLAPGDRRRVRPGHGFHLADVEVVVEDEAERAHAAVGAESTATIARRLVSDLLQVLGGAEPPRLVVETGPGAGRVLRLVQADRGYLLGRADGCDLVIEDQDVSREHARVVRTWEGVRLFDLGSKNGVDVEGERVRGDRRLRDGDALRLGATGLRLEDPEDRYLRQLEAVPEAGTPRPTAGPTDEGASSAGPAAQTPDAAPRLTPASREAGAELRADEPGTSPTRSPVSATVLLACLLLASAALAAVWLAVAR